MSKTGKNRVWPYCDEFEFFSYKKLLLTQSSLSLRVISHDLEPDFPPGQLILFSNTHLVKAKTLWPGDIAAYWDGAKVNFGIFLSVENGQIHFLKTPYNSEKTFFTCSEKYFLSKVEKAKLPLWKKIYYYSLFCFRK